MIDARATPALALLIAGCSASTPTPPPTVVIAPTVEQAPPAPTPSAAPAPTAAAEAPAPECFKAPPKDEQPPPAKREAALKLLKGGEVKLILDARRAGVIVPEYLATEGRLVLQVGYRMAVPIPDLKVDARGVSGTLSFKRHPFFVNVPWAAVYAVVGVDDGRGWIWHDDVPAEQRCK